MRMVRSVLLGSAAGLVAVTAGQAADLPVKAQPVQYVKVCNLYGAGFYYMPGTDMCIKIGGWVRAEITWGANGSMTWGPLNANAQTRTTSNVAMRARGYITADAREQTAYGVARAYIAAGLNTNDVGLQVANFVDSVNRGYVQWAGFTAGLAQSFYDFYSVPAMTYRGGYFPASDTGDGGWWVWGYTAQFGGGFSATVAAEARRTTQIIDANCASTGSTTTPTCGFLAPGANPTAITAGGAPLATGSGISPGVGAYGGQQTPDVVANLRLDQAWGSAQVMGAYHEVNASFYGDTATGAPAAASLAHPSDAAGWVVGAGLKINFPTVAPGDYFQSQFNYTEGALRYLFMTPNSNWGVVSGDGVDGTQGFGVLSDCVFGGSSSTAGVPTSTTGCQLTTAWGFNAGYEHYWTPNWHESFFGNYYAVSYNSAANNMLCAAAGGGNGVGTGVGSAAVAAAGCNNNWSTWGAGTRLQWDVTKSFYVGVEALYQQINSATIAPGATLGAYAASGAGQVPGTTGVTGNQSIWSFTARIHKDFLP
jgi:hypothetical protein